MEQLDSKYSKTQDRIVLKGQFLLTRFSKHLGPFNSYDGVDIKSRQPITLIVKAHKNAETTRYRRDMHSRLSDCAPQLLWEGDERVNKLYYHVDIFEKLGPNLKQILKLVEFTIPTVTLYILAYHLIRLLQRLSENKLVLRGISFSRITLAKTQGKNQLYFSDFYDIKKAGETGTRIDKRYASIGSHLGLNASFKDDLESVCYMLLDLTCSRKLFPKSADKKKKIETLLAFKSALTPEQLSSVPMEFLDFHTYVRNLSAINEPNYEYWRKVFRRCVSPEVIKKPYVWSVTKEDQSNRQDTGDDPQEPKQTPSKQSSNTPVLSQENSPADKEDSSGQDDLESHQYFQDEQSVDLKLFKITSVTSCMHSAFQRPEQPSDSSVS